jgi:hypothetical protein
LGNESGVVRLLRPEALSPDEPDVTPYSLIDEVRYNSVTPWPTEVAGSNRSLHRVVATAFGNEGRNWQARAESPGRVNFQPATPGDFNNDRIVDVKDIDLLCRAVRASDANRMFDLSGDGLVDGADFDRLITEILHTSPGDSNLDRAFDSSDLVLAFISAEYEDGVADNSGWSDGDWNCDGDFTTRDLVDAFITSLYQMPPAVHAVAALPMSARESTDTHRDREPAGRHDPSSMLAVDTDRDARRHAAMLVQSSIVPDESSRRILRERTTNGKEGDPERAI